MVLIFVPFVPVTGIRQVVQGHPAGISAKSNLSFPVE